MFRHTKRIHHRIRRRPIKHRAGPLMLCLTEQELLYHINKTCLFLKQCITFVTLNCNCESFVLFYASLQFPSTTDLSELLSEFIRLTADNESQHLLPSMAFPSVKVQTGLKQSRRNPWMSWHLLGWPLNKKPILSSKVEPIVTLLWYMELRDRGGGGWGY